jgi:hypothetical protein
VRMLPLGGRGTAPEQEAVRPLLDELRGDCTLEEIQYELYVIDLVQLGRAEAEDGKLAPHVGVMNELRRKRSRPSAG